MAHSLSALYPQFPQRRTLLEWVYLICGYGPWLITLTVILVLALARLISGELGVLPPEEIYPALFAICCGILGALSLSACFLLRRRTVTKNSLLRTVLIGGILAGGLALAYSFRGLVEMGFSVEAALLQFTVLLSLAAAINYALWLLGTSPASGSMTASE